MSRTSTAENSIHEKWKHLARETRAEAEKIPEGRARDALIKRANQLDMAYNIEAWLNSPGLRQPQGK